ncbi:MAG: hypothetical protein GYA17_21185 [Chloroflexi bacterium]|nr:hypothetical protein [Chloroflexota bacterium]
MSLLNPQHSLSDVTYERFISLIRVKSGLEIPTVRRPDLEKSVLQLATDLSLSGPEALLEHVSTPAEGDVTLEELIARLTVGETHFFRNRPQFDALEKHILPEIIEMRRPVKRIRVWCAGCATGEEPYSVAVLLKRLLPDLGQWNVFILGTDINRSSLEKARRGRFGAWSFREVPGNFQEDYFTKDGRRYTLKPAIRNMVTFTYLNLVEDSYPSMLTNTQMMDLILCRNVLIYFNQETGGKVVERLHASLAQQGWLVVGHAEPSQAIFYQFAVHNFPGAILYQKATHSATASPSLPAFPAGSNGRRLPELPRTNSLPLQALPRPPAPVSPKRLSSPGAQPVRPVRHSPPPELQAALASIEAGRVAAARDTLVRLAASYPENAWPPFWLAKICANRMELEEAQRWIDQSLARDSLLAPAWYLKGLVLQELGHLEQSLEALRSCLYADPEFLLGYFNLAGVYQRLAQPRRAIKALQNLEAMLAGRDRQDSIPEGDGLTVGRLSELVSAQQELLK